MILNKKLKNAFGAGSLYRLHDCYLRHCLPFHRQAVSGDSFAVCSIDRMHCLFTGLYCGEKEEVSSFIVFPSTGCTNPGAISASGFMTKSRSAINGWGRINLLLKEKWWKVSNHHKATSQYQSGGRYICR